MSKIAFTKLALKKKNDIKTITINEQEIEVKQYLPVEEKLAIISNVLAAAADENNFANPVKVEVFLSLEIIYNYTNITFTDKQKEDAPKLYDLLEENDVFEQVCCALPKVEYENLLSWTDEVISAFYKYRQSAIGILEQVSADYSNLNLDATEIQNKIADPENLTLLKDVMNKLG